MSPVHTIAEPPGELPDSRSLADFLQALKPFEPEARYGLVEQALALLDGAYVHLRLKRAMHAIDPIQRLRLLQRRLNTFSDLQFHSELAAIFRSLRDLHTVYQLPDPFRGHVATLGFLVERCNERQQPVYLVTKVDPALEHAGFAGGVELHAWNGVPIDRAVELNAERQAGSNPDARLARGLEALTLRPLRTAPPPDERWVILEYRSAGAEPAEIRIPWRVAAAAQRAGRAQDPVSTITAVLGIDAGNEATRQIKRRLFAPTHAAEAQPQELDGVLYTGARTISGRELAYLRLFSFNVPSARPFLEALAERLAGLPPNGLIIDIRGNPGGHILAAEGALQLLTRRPVVPARFSFTTTPLALELCQTSPALAAWADSISAAVETGEAYSQPLPLSDPPQLAARLPRYPGPQVLVTDALCYSAADIFAAGFQDNALGPILGTARHTGAGGANVWTHDLLRRWLSDRFEALPASASFRVALRRATRVGDRIGVPLEDLGVEADEVHELTRRDITDRNADLLVAAAGLLDRSSPG
jgi:hypothetical protein